MHTYIHTHTEGNTYRQSGIQRQTYSHTDNHIQIGRQRHTIEIITHAQTDREANRQTERQTVIHTYRQTETGKHRLIERLTEAATVRQSQMQRHT